MANWNLSPIGNEWQFFGAAGANYPPNLPLNGGFLNTFQGGTNTPIATYANNLGSIQNSPTMQLGPDGRFTGAIWLAAGQGYKFQLTDSTGFQIWMVDNIVGINDAGSGVTSEWIASGVTPTYSSANVFTTSGNTTNIFLPGGNAGLRVKATVTAGQVYGSVISAVFGAATTVTLAMDAGMALDNGLNAVSVGLLSTNDPSVPASIPYAMTWGGLSNFTNANPSTFNANPIVTNPVAFHTHRSINQTSGTTIIFDTVDNQIGGTNYSNSTGVFTAPYNGWYLLTSSIFYQLNSGNQGQVAYLVVNGVNVAGVNGIAQASVATWILDVSSVIFMSSGQTASITPTSLSASNFVVGDTRSSFSGFMLARTS